MTRIYLYYVERNSSGYRGIPGFPDNLKLYMNDIKSSSMGHTKKWGVVFEWWIFDPEFSSHFISMDPSKKLEPGYYYGMLWDESYSMQKLKRLYGIEMPTAKIDDDSIIIFLSPDKEIIGFYIKAMPCNIRIKISPDYRDKVSKFVEKIKREAMEKIDEFNWVNFRCHKQDIEKREISLSKKPIQIFGFSPGVWTEGGRKPLIFKDITDIIDIELLHQEIMALPSSISTNIEVQETSKKILDKLKELKVQLSEEEFIFIESMMMKSIFDRVVSHKVSGEEIERFINKNSLTLLVDGESNILSNKKYIIWPVWSSTRIAYFDTKRLQKIRPGRGYFMVIVRESNKIYFGKIIAKIMRNDRISDDKFTKIVDKEFYKGFFRKRARNLVLLIIDSLNDITPDKGDKEVLRELATLEQQCILPRYGNEYHLINLNYFTEKSRDSHIGQEIRRLINIWGKQSLYEKISKHPLFYPIIAHLLSGRNIVLIGPPGSGKTRLAENLTEFVCGKGNFSLVTANAEWTHFDVIGGLTIEEGSGGSLKARFKLGFLSRAVLRHYESMLFGGRPHWLIIDEINRANLDLAFGEAFTALDIEHRDSVVAVGFRDLQNIFASNEFKRLNAYRDLFKSGLKIPKSFRILATLNPYDRAILHKLGYAFRRRFAFVRVPGILEDLYMSYQQPTPQRSEASSGESSEEKTAGGSSIRSFIDISDDDVNKYGKYIDGVLGEVKNWLEDIRSTINNPLDNVLGVPKELLEALIGGDVCKGFSDTYSKLKDKLRKLVTYAISLFKFDFSRAPIIDIGYAELVDLAKFVVAYSVLCGDYSDDNVIRAFDYALSSYVIPQLEYLSNLIVGDINLREKVKGMLLRKYDEFRKYGLWSSVIELINIARNLGIGLETEREVLRR